MCRLEGNEMNPKIDELQAGDWVQIANGDWRQVKREPSICNACFVQTSSFCACYIGHLGDLITDTHRGDEPPLTDKARLEMAYKWIRLHPPTMPDHACAECCPNSDMLKPGFICQYHAAIRDSQKEKGQDDE